MKAYRFILIFFILAFIGYQLYLIANDFSTTRIIEVRKEIYDSNEKDYLKAFDIADIPFEQFDLEITPKSFADYLLITNEKGCLLSIILNIAAACCLAVYIYKLARYESIFDVKTNVWINSAILLAAVAFTVLSYGIEHTNDLWKSTYRFQAKPDVWGDRFYFETKNNFMIYFWIIIVFGNFYREVLFDNKPATVKLDVSKVS